MPPIVFVIQLADKPPNRYRFLISEVFAYKKMESAR